MKPVTFQDLIKGPHKYVKRVPTGNPKRPWRYYYAESAVARDVKAGEEVVLGDDKVKVLAAYKDGRVRIELHGVKRTVNADQWGELIASHYGDRYYAWAEKRAQQSVNAVMRHVPRELLTDLTGSDEERLAQLKKRVPDVYKRLEAGIRRAGVSPFRAKRILSRVLERRGWAPEARAAVIGQVLVKRDRNYRQIMWAAENLAGGTQVQVKHVGAVIDLRNPANTTFASHVAATAAAAEKELSTLSAALARAGKEDKSGEVLRAALGPAMAKLQMLAQAFPDLQDKAIEPTRKALAEAPSKAPRAEPTRQGSQTAVYVAAPDGSPQALKASYKLVEADEALASHKPAESFGRRDGYPEGVQERAYHRDKAEQAKVIRNAQRMNPAFVVNTNPDAVNGPPIMDESGVVLGGNSRTMSMQLAYAKHPEQAAKMRDYLAEHAHEVGLTADDVGAMKNPILVRVVEGKKDKSEQKLLVRQMNESFTQGMDPRTMQVAMGRKLDDAALNELSDSMKPDESLNEFLGSARADGFVNALRRAGVVDARNANQYLHPKTGRLNEDGKTMVSRILVGRTIGDADLLSTTGVGMVNNLARSIPLMAQAKRSGDKYDLSGDLRMALETYNHQQYQAQQGHRSALTADMTDRDIDRMFAQEGLAFEEPDPIAKSPRAMELLKVLIRKNGPQKMAGVFREYARQAAQHPEDQPGMVFEPPPEPIEMLKQAMRKSLIGRYRLVKAGPFVGPRGGKWADAKHTIPYEGNVKRALYHAAPANVMHKIKDEGLTARAGGSLYQQGHYQEHSAGKVHLADNPQAGRHWHENTERQLEAQHDDPKDHDAVMLRVKHRRTALDPVGDKDVPGSRFTRKDIDPGDLEYHDKKHGWRPVEHWQPGSHSLPTDEQAAQPGREAHRIREQRKKAEADRADSRKRSEAQADKWRAEAEALDKEWSAKPAAEREAKAKELASKRSPIPGMTQLKPDWQKRLGVDAKGNLLKAFYKERDPLNSGLTKAGPYIGPKGGKWADAKHTIPYRLMVRPHKDVVSRNEPTEYEVRETEDGKVRLGEYGPIMPKASVKHFVNDLEGRVDLPKHDSHAAINAVVSGKAKLLGKGDDGIAFKVGDQVVKVSTTVPYQPENQGHRTPDEAADMLKRQVEVGNKLADKIPGIQRSEYVRHGDKGFQVKEYVDIPEKFTAKQLDQVQDILIAMHKQGYALNDQVQPGIRDGKVVMFDVGKAAKIPEGQNKHARTDDMDSLRMLYREHDQEFVRKDVNEGEQAWQKVRAMGDKLLGSNPSPATIRMLTMQADAATAKRRKFAESQLSDKDRADALETIDIDREVLGWEIDAALGKSMQKAHKLHRRRKWNGLDISIETQAGAYRYWTDSDGSEGRTKMKYDYGYIRRTRGVDGDHVDVFVGPDEHATHVYIVHQRQGGNFRRFDEQKCMLGFDSVEDATIAYLRHYDDTRFLGSIKTMPLGEFKSKVLQTRDPRTKHMVKATRYYVSKGG